MAVKVTVYGTADMRQIENARHQLDRLQAQAVTSATGFAGAMGRISQSANDIGGSMVDMGKSMTTHLTLPIAAMGFAAYKSVQAASDLAETQSKVGVVFGNSAADIEKWSNTSATAFGQSKQQALDAASTFAIFGRSAGLSGQNLVKFSTDMTGLASDMASFSNTSPQEAIEAIGAALRGESEPIRKYGVLLDDAALKARALALGIYDGTDALTPQQKVLAAQAEIMAQTTAAQGDFARTSDGLANKQRIMQAELSNTSAEIGTSLLPIALDLVNFFRKDVMPVIQDAANWFKGLDDGTKRAGLGFLAVAAAAGPLLVVGGSIVKGFGQIAGGIGSVVSVTGKAVGGVKNLVDGITNAHGTVSAFATPMQNLGAHIRNGASAVGSFTVELAKNAAAMAVTAARWIASTAVIIAHKTAQLAANVATGLATAAQWLLNVAMAANPIGLIVIAIAALVAGLVWFFTQTDLGRQIWEGFVNGLTSLWNGFVKWFGDIVNAVVTWVGQNWGLLLSFLIGPIGLAIQWLVQNWSGVVAWFQGAIAGFVGFWRDTWRNVSNFFSNMWSNIRDVLSGAGRWLVDVGRNIVMGLWEGIRGTWDNVMNWIGGLFNGFIDKVKGLLGIQSPSVVFAGIGNNIAAGMAQGIKAGAPAVSDALGDLTAAGTASVSLGTSGTPSFGGASRSVMVAEGAVQITIQGSADGRSVKSVVDDAFAALVRELRAS